MIDITKNWETRSGLEVKILGVAPEPNDNEEYPIFGFVKNEDGVWMAESWTKEGVYVAGKTRDYDLVEIKTEEEKWDEIEKEWVKRKYYESIIDYLKQNYKAPEKL